MSLLKKFLKWLLLALLVLIVVFNVYILVSGKYYLYSAVYHNFATIDDYKFFTNRTIRKSTKPEPWPISTSYNKINVSAPLINNLEEYSSIAFLIIKEDSLLYERYWDNYSDTSHSGSFSMAKSFVSALVGAAIREGKIKSVEQPVSDFLPWFKKGEKKNILIRHLLTMSSGLEWDEAYANPFSVTTEAYYGDNLPSLFQSQQVESQPGKEFDYKSGDTQLLGFIVEKATGKSLAQYAEEKLWQPMGAENDAYWSLDKKNGHEKAYCCINSNARDFARIGYLYMHKGNWKGKQLIDSSYVEASTKCAGLGYQGGKCDFYGYQWWVVPDYKGIKLFYARGILGQLVVVVPEWNMIAVRLGKSRGEKVNNHFGLVFNIVDEMSSLKGK